MADPVTVIHLLDPPAAARYINMSPETMRVWRSTGTGPPFIRIASNPVRYRVSDLDAWRDGLRISTDDQD
ncbi:helix-turn-helix transcriptional regulator [Mycobacterium lehmannii]|uniref:helix-turn-helix transcriptional regulator n=1 Tax=Mycobacterium lehmannii TaxID=2048550 RepID=UPI000A550644|nr:helix-turn-helix domain-containing protein [Mycobacterium lehmannii]